jgi:hypothetical protein
MDQQVESLNFSNEPRSLPAQVSTNKATVIAGLSTAQKIALTSDKIATAPAPQKKGKVVAAEKGNIQCNHDDWVSFKSQEMLSYCNEGYELHQVVCAAEGCKIQGYVAPAQSMAVHHCKNVGTCKYAYCHSCYSVLLTKAPKQTRRRRGSMR